MIPLRPDEASLASYRANIRAAWESATRAQRVAGEQWYPAAHDLAADLGAGDVRMGAGLLAALSANKRWPDTVKLALDASDGHVHGHTGANLAKVHAILAGADPARVLPMGSKTGQFYLNILDPSDPFPVTVDRHAHDIAAGHVFGEGERGLSTAARYTMIAGQYRQVAAEYGVPACRVQARTWVVQVDKLAGTGTRMAQAGHLLSR